MVEPEIAPFGGLPTTGLPVPVFVRVNEKFPGVESSDLSYVADTVDGGCTVEASAGDVEVSAGGVSTVKLHVVVVALPTASCTVATAWYVPSGKEALGVKVIVEPDTDPLAGLPVTAWLVPVLVKVNEN